MSGSPKPASRWGRMGGVVRRASSVLVATRPSTPSIASDRDADASSLRNQRVDTTPAALTPPPAPVTHVPSPIAESPAREAAASQEEVAPLGPSPLARNEDNAVPDPTEATSPVGYIPPPVIDSSAGNPGAFTDEPEDLPQPTVITDPFASGSTDGHSTSHHEVLAPVDVPTGVESQELEQVPAETHLTEEAPAFEASRDIQPPVVEEHQDPQPPVVEETYHNEETRTVDIPVDEIQPEEVHTAVEMPQVPVFSPPVSYFDNPMVQSHGDVDSINQPSITFVEPVHVGSSDVPDAGPADVASRDVAPEVLSREVEHFDGGMVEHFDMPVPPHEQHQSEAPSYTLPNYDIHSDQEIWGGNNQAQPYEDTRPTEMPREIVEPSYPSHASSVRQLPLEDPFAEPLVPRITLSQHDYVLNMPHPQPLGPHEQEPYETHEDAQGAIIMPLPAFNQVIASRSLHNGTSNDSFNENGHGNYVETNERQPLLSNQGTSKHQSYLQPSSYNHLIISAQSPAQSSSTWHSTVAPRLHDLGWIEYHLPDGTFYYVHPTRRVTTDINLRTEKMLSAVTSFFDEHKDSAGAPVGAELWLRDIGNTKRGFIPLRCWVDHHSRAVIMDRVHHPGKGKRVAEDDQLDMEYRYWSFMEGHPAHTTLPAKAKGEALDVLTWAWTDRLLPSHSAIAAPFTQEECQNLTNLLHSSTGDNQGDAGIQTLIVSRILLRVAHWRQHHFRPNKPLPKDANVNAIRFPVQRRPFRRAFFDFVVSCFCLGIPYLFFQRSQHHRLDEESGLRNAGPILVIGACTCLVAAIVLSASVTFLSLPGLDNFARVAGLVAILFASFSMASTVVAIFRYKADVERGISHIGGEGMVSLSKRTVVMSLPLVFLAYAVIGFVAGIVLYSFRGVTTSDPALIKNHFDDYTKWTVVGVLGGLAGMLTTSFLLIRQ